MVKSGGGKRTVRFAATEQEQDAAGLRAKRFPKAPHPRTLVRDGNAIGKTRRSSLPNDATAAALAAHAGRETPRDFARARLGRASRSGSGAQRCSGRSVTVTAMPSSLRNPHEATHDTSVDSLCADFGGARLRSHECRIDRSSGFVRSLPALMPLPPGTDYTLHVFNRTIGAESVVTASALPTPAPRPRRASGGSSAGSAGSAAAAAAMAECADAMGTGEAGARGGNGNGKLMITSTKLVPPLEGGLGKIVFVVRNVSTSEPTAAFRLSFSVFG